MIQLKQHNIAPTTHLTDFGDGVVNDDQTCLYSVDRYDVNLIHCIEMAPNVWDHNSFKTQTLMLLHQNVWDHIEERLKTCPTRKKASEVSEDW